METKVKRKEPKKWLKARSIRFDRTKLIKAKKKGVLNQLSDKCREQLDLLIKD